MSYRDRISQSSFCHLDRHQDCQSRADRKGVLPYTRAADQTDLCRCPCHTRPPRKVEQMFIDGVEADLRFVAGASRCGCRLERSDNGDTFIWLCALHQPNDQVRRISDAQLTTENSR